MRDDMDVGTNPIEGTPPSPTQMLPRWKCHKEVHGGVIEGMTTARRGKELPVDIQVKSPDPILHLQGGIDVTVTWKWFNRHDPRVGGYYVIYEDGYRSYSPGAAFERGYARIR